MAIATYSTDMQDILLDFPNTTGWTALGGGPAGLSAPETDAYIQGSNSISKAAWAGATRGMIYNTGAGQAVPSGSAFYMWIYYMAPNALDTEANGGVRMLVGSSATAYRHWYIKGSDTLTYGGWVCAVVDPLTTPDSTTGTPTTTYQYFGSVCAILASGPTKGNPLCIDAFRYGRSISVINGESGGYGTFAGISLYNDDISRRLGIFQFIDGSYLQQGAILFGSVGNAVYFNDSNRNILIGNTKKVQSSFNGYEIRNSNSEVYLDNISITALGTVSKGNFTVIDNAIVSVASCTFSDMDTFVFLSNSNISKTKFRRCGLITQGGSTISECSFENTTDTAKALLSNDPGKITNCNFISSGTKHAIEMNTAGSYTFNGNEFTGYASSNGSTGNECIYNNSGGHIELNITYGANVSVRNGTNATTDIIVGQRILSLEGIVTGSRVRILEHGTSTVLDGTDSSETIFQYTYTYASNTYIDIVILIEEYLYWRIEEYNLLDANSSIPVQQIYDRQYYNPPGGP